MTAPHRIEPGPQVGIPPSLEQVPITRLQVDPTYQRATDSEASRRVIAGMVKQWNWTLCQPLVVARRTDGSLWVLDGQHRLAGAKERGDIPFVPCVISSSLDHAEEARTFVELNTRRQKLNQGEIFHGMLAAGDPDAKAVQQLLDDTGWRVRKISNTAAYGPGDLECAPMLTRMLATRGADPVRFALTVLRTAYPKTTVRQSATFLKSVAELFDQIDDSTVTAQRLIDTIGSVEPYKWTARAVALQETNRGLSLPTAIARAMLAAVQGKPAPTASRPVTAVTPPQPFAKPVAAPTRRIAPTPERAFGTSGKGWCEQCEQLRTREAAAACVSRHCKLRGHA